MGRADGGLNATAVAWMPMRRPGGRTARRGKLPRMPQPRAPPSRPPALPPSPSSRTSFRNTLHLDIVRSASSLGPKRASRAVASASERPPSPVGGRGSGPPAGGLIESAIVEGEGATRVTWLPADRRRLSHPHRRLWRRGRDPRRSRRIGLHGAAQDGEGAWPVQDGQGRRRGRGARRVAPPRVHARSHGRVRETRAGAAAGGGRRGMGWTGGKFLSRSARLAALLPTIFRRWTCPRTRRPDR